MVSNVALSSLRPVAVASDMHRHRLRLDIPELLFLDALDPAHAEFSLAMNRANCLAYDGAASFTGDGSALGMPLWTLLDCCLVPSVMVGFAVSRVALPRDFVDTVDPGGAVDTLGVSEFIAVPSLEPGRVVGISLFASIPGHALGRRTKALGLYVHQAHEQIGVTQYGNASIRLHLSFGPMEVLASNVRVHSRPGETFVYRVTVPTPETLRAMVDGDLAHAWDREIWRDAATHVRVEASGRLAGNATLAPGSVLVDAVVEEGRVVSLAYLSAEAAQTLLRDAHRGRLEP